MGLRHLRGSRCKISWQVVYRQEDEEGGDGVPSSEDPPEGRGNTTVGGGAGLPRVG